MALPLLKRTRTLGNSLEVQWLGLLAFTAEGPGSIPGQGTKIPQAMWWAKKKMKANIDIFSLTDSRWFMAQHYIKSPSEACYYVTELLRF